MKILVTGGAGFIGSHIVEHYQDKAEEIRVLDNLRTGYLKTWKGSGTHSSKVPSATGSWCARRCRGWTIFSIWPRSSPCRNP